MNLNPDQSQLKWFYEPQISSKERNLNHPISYLKYARLAGKYLENQGKLNKLQ